MPADISEHWYDKLCDYFPGHEMKDREEIRELLKHKQEYHKQETDDYLLLYAEFPSFIFIDYFLVTADSRGKGIGTKVLSDLKKKQKMIVLEAEPVDRDDEETVRRMRFYEKNDFLRADRIEYRRKDDDGDMYTLDILYWTPKDMSQEAVFENMKTACTEIHHFRDPDKALELK